MRIKGYDGTVKEVRSVRPVVEKRFRFNRRTVRMAETACSAKEYIDVSQWDYQSNKDVFLGYEGTVFDEGKTKPYLSAGMVVGMQSPFTGVPIQGEDFVNTRNWDDIEYELHAATPEAEVEGTIYDLARWTKEICQCGFLLHSVSLTVVQLRSEADLEVLLQAMLLLDSRHEGYDAWKGISTAEVTKYCGHIRGTYNDDKRQMIAEPMEYLFKAFPEKHKFLKKSKISTVILLSKLALENEIVPDCFKTFLDSFSNSVCPAYEANTGSGNVKRTKTEGRLSAIAGAFAEYFHLGDVHILNMNGGTDTECEENADAENSEAADAPASTEEETPSEEENFKDSAESETALETEDLESGRDSMEEEVYVNEESA